MKNIFNFKLYLEGLKKIRLVGIIVGIVVIGGTALPPIAELLDDTMSSSANVIGASEFAIPLILILFLTPFFFLSMFSFLNKRNESDFYHAIPYKRSCVLFSFLAAIYTWIWGIVLVATLLTAVLWWLCPAVTFSASLIPLTFFIYAVTALYIGGFILLAMSLTGTVISNISVSIILLFSFRIIGIMLVTTLENMVPMFDIAYSPAQFFSLKYWLPAAVISSFYDTTVFQSVSLWIYSGLVTVGLYALATFAYCRRKSESAGKSAPGKILQHVYRCAFTLPFALLTTMAIILGESLDFVAVLLLLALGVYYIYELITVKNIKSALRSTPYLLVLLACCILFTAGCYATSQYVHSAEYEADEIKEIRLYEYDSIFDLFDSSTNGYEDLVTGDISVPDQEAREIVAKALSETIKYETTTLYDYTVYGVREYVEITLQSGRKIGRRLYFTEEERAELTKIMTASEEYKNAYISLPDGDSIQSLSIAFGTDISDKELRRLWETFEKEYNALTDEEKIRFKQTNSSNGIDYYGGMAYTKDTAIESMSILGLSIHVLGSMNSKEYYANYTIPADFTETRKMYFELLEGAQKKTREYMEAFIDADYDTFTVDGIETLYWYNLSFSLSSDFYSTAYDYNWEEYHPLGKQEFERTQEILQILLPYLTNTPTDENFCTVYLSWNSDDQYYSQNVLFGLKPLTEEEQFALEAAIAGIDEKYTSAMKKELNRFIEGNYDSYFSINSAYSYFYLSFDLTNGENTISYSILNSDIDSQKKLEYAKELIKLLLPYLGQAEDFTKMYCKATLEYENEYGDWVTESCVFGWGEPDEETKVKLDELLSQMSGGVI